MESNNFFRILIFSCFICLFSIFRISRPKNARTSNSGESTHQQGHLAPPLPHARPLLGPYAGLVRRRRKLWLPNGATTAYAYALSADAAAHSWTQIFIQNLKTL
jgi:hypothetical protein